MSEDTTESQQEEVKVLVNDNPATTPKTIEELRAYLGTFDRQSIFIDSPSAINFFKSDKNLFTVDTGQGKYPLTNSGFERFCKLIKVPSKFLLSLPHDNTFKDLKSTLYRAPITGINFIIKNGVIVGVSNKEQTTSAIEVLDRVFTDNHNFKIRNIGMEGEELILDFTRDSISPIVGDELECGLSLHHSDHDGSHPSLHNYIYRLICSNGAKALTSNKVAKFSGRMTKDKVFEILNERISTNIELIMSNLTSSIEKLNNTTIPTDEKKYIRGFLRKKLEFKDHDDIEASYDEKIHNKGEPTFYDLMNFITDSAKNFDIVNRDRIESLGGQLVVNFNPDRPTMELFRGYEAYKFNARKKELENSTL